MSYSLKQFNKNWSNSFKSDKKLSKIDFFIFLGVKEIPKFYIYYLLFKNTKFYASIKLSISFLLSLYVYISLFYFFIVIKKYLIE